MLKSYIVLILYFLCRVALAGQVTITHGGTYTFNANGVVINTAEGVTLKGCGIYGQGIWIAPGSCVFLDHCTLNGASGVFSWKPAFLWVDHCEIDGADNGLNVMGDPDNATETQAQVTVSYTRFRNCHIGIQFNGMHNDPNMAIIWCEVLSSRGSSDAINIYRSSGSLGHPIVIQNNYVQGVAPLNIADTTFTGGGIVMDGAIDDPSIATSSVDISQNRVVGCVSNGIALAFGLNVIAHDNTIISSHMDSSGQLYACFGYGLSIEGTLPYQPQAWLNWLQAMDNTVGACSSAGQREDVLLWYPSISSRYIQGTISPHDGQITLDDERCQLTLWKQKLATSGIAVGP